MTYLKQHIEYFHFSYNIQLNLPVLSHGEKRTFRAKLEANKFPCHGGAVVDFLGL